MKINDLISDSDLYLNVENSLYELVPVQQQPKITFPLNLKGHIDVIEKSDGESYSIGSTQDLWHYLTSQILTDAVSI